jgi:fatty acid amide hydrolase
MIDGLARGDFSTRELVDAHLDRIHSLDARLHAFTTVFDDEARAHASRLDDERAAGKVRGPLHGVPISVKECLDLEGHPTTLGLRSRQNTVATRDAAMVTLLREMGAVILGRTNLSQTMLFAESRNPLFGQTANPWSLAHSPAAVCGVCALKPTLDLLPMRGVQGVLRGQEAVRSMLGTITRTVDDQARVYAAFPRDRMAALDPRVPPLPWRDPGEVNLRGLRVGWYTDDGTLPVSASVRRAVETAADVLAAQGVTVIPCTPPNVPGLVADYLGALSADGGETLRAALGSDPPDPTLAPLLSLAKIPDRGRVVLARAASLVGQGRLGAMLDAMGEKSVAELWRLTDRLRAWRFEVLDVMDRARLDALVCPAFATPALPHGMSKNFTLASVSALTWNAAQFPGGVVPVGRVRGEETRRAGGRDAMERHAAKVDAQSAGLPLSVQVVGRPWQEPTVLALMAAVERVVREAEDFPRTPVDPR